MKNSDIPADRLLAIARNYWPVSKEDDAELKYRRLIEVWDQELKRHDQWHALRRKVMRAFPGFSAGDGTATPDACTRCVVYSPPIPPPEMGRFIVVGCKSILAPVYTIYGVEYGREDTGRRSPKVVFAPLPERMQPIAEVIAQQLESLYGVSLLPREVADTPVPLYIEPMEPPHTTLFHALFTSEPESLP